MFYPLTHEREIVKLLYASQAWNLLSERSTAYESVQWRRVSEKLFEVDHTERSTVPDAIVNLLFYWLAIKFFFMSKYLQEIESDLERFGERVSSDIYKLARECEINQPYVEHFDAWGNRYSQPTLSSSYLFP